MHNPEEEQVSTGKRKLISDRADKYIRERLKKFSRHELSSLYVAIQEEMLERKSGSSGDDDASLLPVHSTQLRYYELFKLEGPDGDSPILFRIPSNKLTEEEIGHMAALKNVSPYDVFRKYCPIAKIRAFWYISSCIGEYERATFEWAMDKYGDPSVFSSEFVEQCVEAMGKWKEHLQKDLSSGNNAYFINFIDGNFLS